MRRDARATFFEVTKAAVAPTVALSLFALIGAGGIAFDYARLATMDTELQNAADQAALAAASQLDGTTATRMARAEARSRGRSLTNTTLFVQRCRRHERDHLGRERAVAVRHRHGPARRVLCKQADAESGCNGFADPTRFAEAKFVHVGVTARQAVYALTPIVGAFRSGTIDADATRRPGLGDLQGAAGDDLQPQPRHRPSPVDCRAKAWACSWFVHRQGQSWAPGNFGYLDAGHDE